MKLFLTSSILDMPDGLFNPLNDFISHLRDSISEGSELVFISAIPDDNTGNDENARILVSAFDKIGVIFSDVVIIDSRNQEIASDILGSGKKQVVVLSHGDVFSQNLFFHKIELKKLLKNFEGVIIASGGGAMNCSSVLYVMPRTLDQAFSTKFSKFLPGLGLTNRAIIPHYEQVRGRTLGSLRYMEDVILSDSLGRSFYAIPDGSFIEYEDGFETIFGDVWHIHDGELTQIS